MGGDRSIVILWVIVAASALALFALHDGQRDVALFVFFLATSCLVAIHLRKRAVSRVAGRVFVGAFPFAFAVAFVAVHAIGRRTESFPALATTLGLEVLLLGALVSFELRYWRGFERVSALLCAEASGYATVVDLRRAAPHMAAQFARSARYGEPLTVVVLERDPRREPPAMDGFADALGRAGPGVLDHLSRLVARTQVCSMVSDSARRSDLVATESDSRVIVVSGATPQAGAERFAERMVRASETKLGIPLVAGVAACPGDGATLDELVELASRRATAVDEIGARLERRDAEVAELPEIALRAPLTGTET